MRRRVGTCKAWTCAVALAWAGANAAPAETGVDVAAPAPPALGIVAADGTGGAIDAADLSSLFVRRVADWGAIENADGELDWGDLETEIERLHRAGARVVLALTGSHPKHVPSGGLPSPFDPGAVDAWTRFVRGAVARFGGRIDTLAIWDRDSVGGVRLDVENYAYLLKTSVVAARAEAREKQVSIRLAQVTIGPGDLDWQKDLWALDAAAYTDILPMALDVDERTDVPAAVGALLDETLRHPPAAEVWVASGPAPGGTPWLAAAACIEALARGAAVALLDTTADEQGRPESVRWVAGARRLLAGGYAPAPLPGARFEDAAGNHRRDAMLVGSFLDEKSFRTLLFYLAPGSSSDVPDERVILDTGFVRAARLIDPATGQELNVGSSSAGESGRGRSVRITTAPYPLALVFDRPAATEGFELPPEAVETTRERELTAEEIIARYQQVQKFQDDHLERWMARGRIDYHFRFAQGGSTIDVSIDTHYFWQRGGELEWEEMDYYINGNLVPWKHFPQIPLIQPEKVISLPLDLTLDRTYVYRLVGRDKVEGREAYVLEFSPADPAAPASLYRGRVWIDVEEFYRVKASLVQTQLESPILSNEETDRYAAQVDDRGNAFWMLNRIDGQQVWNTAGRNFVVRREVTFLEYQVNPPTDEFEARRATAYRSDHNMMRDTNEGFRYLERQPDGSRTLTAPRTSQWFAAAGAFADQSTDGVQPFAGANYFNFDLAGSGIQFNALIGGVVNFVTASKPDLAGGDVSLTGDLFASALFFRDQVFLGEDELVTERIDTRGQNLNVRLGWRTAPFVKLNLIGAVSFEQYDQNDDGSDALARYNESHPGQSLRFVQPPDSTLLSAGVEMEANRRGYSLVAGWDVTERPGWDAWGVFDDSTGSFVTYDPASATYVPSTPPSAESTFVHWGATGFKEWYLPAFQKIRAEVNYLDGAKLDRFSKYQFSQFGDDRLNGFAGTGVRFDRGLIGRVGYSFNLFEVIRFDAAVENAWVRDDDAFDRTLSFTGAGIAANFVGPWKTVFSVSYGRALASDIPELDHSDEFFALVLKLF